MSDYMDFAEAHAQKQLEQDERREAAIRADERRRVLDALEARVRERQSYGSTALDGVLSDIDAMRQDGEQ